MEMGKHPIIWDIRAMRCNFMQLTFTHVSRVFTGLAHSLVWTCLNSGLMLWLNNYSSWIENVARSESSLFVPIRDY